MKTSLLRYYFNQIWTKCDGDISSNSEIIDFPDGSSISIDEVENEYEKYIDLCEDITYYVDTNYLDRDDDKEKIKKHFSNIDSDLFLYSQAFLLDFVNYMKIKIEKKLLD